MDSVNSFLNQYKIALVLSFVGIVLILGGIFASGSHKKETSASMNFSDKSIVQPTEKLIKVDISGAVNSPGVYSLNPNSRVEDVIKIAQGFKTGANQEYISKRLNLSQKISDGAKIYIPFQNEEGVVMGVQSSVNGSVGSKMGINSATKDQLNELPGVGPVTSQKMIDARPYSSVEELISKKVVSRSVYDKIKELVDIN